MRYHQLGNSELNVSEICLGTMTWGQQNTQQEAHAQLDYALAQGVNFVDAAEMYPVPTRAETQGETERILGAWLEKKPRDSVLVATKIASSGRPIQWLRGGKLAVNSAQVQEAVNASLKRLRTDYIDLYQIHWPDRYVPHFGETVYDPTREREATPIAEQLEALAQVIRQGKVRYWGLSNETAWGALSFLHTADKLGLPRPITIQNAYNLMNRHYDSALAEVSRREQLELLAYSPLGFGFLTGKHRRGPAPGSRVALFESFPVRYRKPFVDEASAAYADVAEKHGLTPAALALAFVRTRFFVKSTIIGATSQAQLVENIASTSVELSADVLADIEAVHTRYPNPAP